MLEMADLNSSKESGTSPTSSCVVHPVTSSACETSMWEEWTQASTGEEVSTTSLLPDLNPTSSSRLMSFQPSDMLSSWLTGSFHVLSHNSLSTDHDLAHNSDSVDQPPAFMQEGLTADPDHSTYSSSASTLVGSVTSIRDPEYDEKHRREVSSQFEHGKSTAPNNLLQALGPESPSSPLAFHNAGLQHPFVDHWDCGSHPNLSSLRAVNAGVSNDARNNFVPDHSPIAVNNLEAFATRYGRHVPRPRHNDIFVGPQGNFAATLVGWAPQYFERSAGVALSSSVRPLKLMASLREAVETTSLCSNQSKISSPARLEQDLDISRGEDRNSTAGSTPTSNFFTNGLKRAHVSDEDHSWPGKHRLELVEVCGGDTDNTQPLKRPNVAVDQVRENLDVLRRMECLAPTTNVVAVGPALNTNGKPRARRGSATDPQSVYARHRRERINERLKTLQHLVPNGAKVDIVTMLEEAITYVKFLQLQVKLLRSDEYWMYATPHTYNGIDNSNSPLQTPGLESSA